MRYLFIFTTLLNLPCFLSAQEIPLDPDLLDVYRYEIKKCGANDTVKKTKNTTIRYYEGGVLLLPIEKELLYIDTSYFLNIKDIPPHAVEWIPRGEKHPYRVNRRPYSYNHDYYYDYEVLSIYKMFVPDTGNAETIKYDIRKQLKKSYQETYASKVNYKMEIHEIFRTKRASVIPLNQYDKYDEEYELYEWENPSKHIHNAPIAIIFDPGYYCVKRTKSPHWESVQLFLKAWGYNIRITNRIDDQTKEVLTKFHRKHGIPTNCSNDSLSDDFYKQLFGK